MPTTKRALIAPREDVVDKFGHLPGDRALPKGGGDPPKRSRRGKAGTAEASGGASISDAAQPAQSVAAGAGEEAGSVAYTFSYLDPPKVKLDNVRASAERQLKEKGWTPSEIAGFIAGLGVLGARPLSSLEDRQLALEELLRNLSELPFYKDKKLFAALTAGPRAYREDDNTRMMFCLKEPTAEGVCMAPVGSPTYTLEACQAKILAEAAARGKAMPELAHVDDDDWAARPLGRTGHIVRAAMLALGSHADGIGFGDILAHIVPFKEAQTIDFQANVHAPLDGAFAAAHAMIDFYVRTVGVRATVAMGVPSYVAWRGCIERWAKKQDGRSAVLYDVIETPMGPIEVEWTAAVLGELGVVAAARTGHAVLLHDPHEKMRFHGAVDLVALLAGKPITEKRLEVLQLASSTFTGLRRSQRFLDIEALGREQLRLIGVPEDELKGVSAEDAMAWCGRVLGFEHGAANLEAQGREMLRL